MRMTWRMQERSTGLAAVGAGPRGAILKVDGEDMGRVSPLGGGWSPLRGWYWTARDSAGRVAFRNTSDAPKKTADEAKAECKAYVLACLTAASQPKEAR